LVNAVPACQASALSTRPAKQLTKRPNFCIIYSSMVLLPLLNN
jgi:hypothetical protein